MRPQKCVTKARGKKVGGSSAEIKEISSSPVRNKCLTHNFGHHCCGIGRGRMLCARESQEQVRILPATKRHGSIKSKGVLRPPKSFRESNVLNITAMIRGSWACLCSAAWCYVLAKTVQGAGRLPVLLSPL